MAYVENDRKSIAFAGSKKYHQQGYKGKGINIAVIDSGINVHTEFEDRVRWDISKNFCETCTTATNIHDECGSGHGTGVASLIVGKNCGIAPEATVTSLKVFNAMNECELTWITNALEYVRDNSELFDAVNMSLGFNEGSLSFVSKLLLETAINQVVAKGIPVFVAAGNTGDERYVYPASFAQVISVGAVDIEKKACSFTTMNDEVDVAQIGQNIKMAGLNNSYVVASGTSFASPIVAGIFALIACKYKTLFNKQIPEEVAYEMIKMNTVNVEVEGIDNKTGVGLCTLGNGRSIKFKTNSAQYYIDGELKTMDVPVIRQNWRNYTPVRFSIEPLNAEVFPNADDTFEVIG